MNKKEKEYTILFDEKGVLDKIGIKATSKQMAVFLFGAYCVVEHRDIENIKISMVLKKIDN